MSNIDPSMDDDGPEGYFFDEEAYWYMSGEVDGVHGYASKVALIKPEFQFFYREGYNDGLWKGKVYRQG